MTAEKRSRILRDRAAAVKAIGIAFAIAAAATGAANATAVVDSGRSYPWRNLTLKVTMTAKTDVILVRTTGAHDDARRRTRDESKRKKKKREAASVEKEGRKKQRAGKGQGN